MKKKILLLFACGLFQLSFSQIDTPPVNNYQVNFNQAYTNYPQIPKGMLEAVAFCNTRFDHITHNPGDHESCIEIPKAYGVMGLTLDGKNYFRNNLELVSQLSGFQIADIISDPGTNILAYAKAYAYLLSQSTTAGTNPESQISILIALSELPDGDLQNNFALNSQLYSIFTFLNNEKYQLTYSFPAYTINLVNIFGAANYKILCSPLIVVSEESIIDQDGNQYQKGLSAPPPPTVQSSDYGPAIWNPTSCNFSSRSGTAVSAVAIHTIQGSYAGCVSWVKNCNSNVSAHYLLRSSDGQITQMVPENQKAWHVGSENPYTIGLEHEGYVNNPSWYTVAMYTTSAALVKDICVSSGYGINPTTCWNGASCSGGCVKPASVKIKGHQMFPNQTHTDPGINWNWPYYYCLINGCNSTPTNLSISKLPTCNDRSVTFNWTNNANNLNIDISTDPNWGAWDVKFGVNGTSETGPAGFSNGLTFQPGVTYYWRIYTGSTFIYGPSFTMPNCDPLGYVDIYDCGSIQGWAFDPDFSGQSIDVHIYIDGFFAGSLTTATPRPDVNAAFGISGVHGFNWSVPVSYQDANSHLVQVYAINVPTGNNPLIGTGNIGPCVPVNLQSSSNSICENDNVVLSWTNSGSGWYIDISTSPTFASYSNQAIPNVTSVNAPAGFSPAFTFLPNTVYYWRIWNGSGVHTVAPLSITVNPTPSAATITVSDDSICPGFSTSIWASGSIGGTVSHNFYDAPSGGTLLGQDSITVTPPADFTYYLELINQFGCKSIPNPTAIPIVVNPAPTTPTVIAIPDSVCLGDTAQIIASGSTGGIVFYNFYNALNAGTLLGPSPLTVSPPASTVYYLEAINQYGCIADTGRVPVLLTINPLPNDPTLVFGDISICYNDSTLLVMSSSTADATVSWWNSNSGGTLLVVGDTFTTPALFTSEVYYTQAQSPEGCLNPGGRMPVNVTVNPLPIVTLSNDAVTFNSIFEGQIITFTANPSGLISYTFFLDSVPAQIAASNIFPTNYVKDQQTVAVIATDINGCKNGYDDNMKIEVKPRSNAFTPNGDGINERFLNGLEVSIINRWGMVLYEGKNGWDGQHKGKDLPEGTYYYIIKLYSLTNEVTQISGPVTLVR